MKGNLRSAFICSWVSRFIPPYLMGRLPYAVRWGIKQHVSRCTSCQELKHNEQLIKANLAIYVRKAHQEKAGHFLEHTRDEEKIKRADRNTAIGTPEEKSSSKIS